MTAPELKPCPFCGRAMEITDDLRHYNHPMSACFGRHIGIAASDIDRIEMWNRRADLAAIQPDPNAGAVKVKPLVWIPEDAPCTRFKAEALGGHMMIVELDPKTDPGKYSVGFDLGGLCFKFVLAEYDDFPPKYSAPAKFNGIDDAKAAAQADYEARILAALDVQPYPRDEVIARLVEAAKALEMWDAARGYPVPYRVRDPLRAALAAVKGDNRE